MHNVIAYKISKTPSLLEKARETWRTCAAGMNRIICRFTLRSGADPDVALEAIAALLIAVTEDAILLRSSSPFTGS